MDDLIHTHTPTPPFNRRTKTNYSNSERDERPANSEQDHRLAASLKSAERQEERDQRHPNPTNAIQQ